MTDKSEPKVLHALIYPLPDPPVMPKLTDADLYGATQWRSYIELAPRVDPPDWAPPGQEPPADPGVPSHVAYLSGMWKRRDGHGVQSDLPTGRGKSLETQQLDPWARRSPPAVDV